MGIFARLGGENLKRNQVGAVDFPTNKQETAVGRGEKEREAKH